MIIGFARRLPAMARLALRDLNGLVEDRDVFLRSLQGHTIAYSASENIDMAPAVNSSCGQKLLCSME